MDLQNMEKKRQSVKGRSNYKKALKVVYISSPMKVKTCASKFRAIVQELTGKDSDTARLMDANGGGGEYSPSVSEQRPVEDQETSLVKEELSPNKLSGPVFEDTFYEGDVVVPQMDENFIGMFPSNLFLENSQFDVLRCFNGPRVWG